MKLYYDLHIHSCLSPCGDDDMTPNNILNMSLLKELDVIAVTDHNTGKNVRAIMELSKDFDLLLIPGMEVQTREEVHMLCYFQSVEALEAFEKALDAKRFEIPNRPDHFGNQLILDKEDHLVEVYPYALIMSIDISVEHLIALCKEHGGVCVPAHVNKSANSILANLGFIPKELGIKTIEIHRKSPVNETLIDGYQRIYNSDAHYLEHISERENVVDVASKDILSILKYLSGED